MLFRDRRHAGILLANHLQAYRGDQHAVMLALPRGWMQVGAYRREINTNNRSLGGGEKTNEAGHDVSFREEMWCVGSLRSVYGLMVPAELIA